jgi:hypothetical protein
LCIRQCATETIMDYWIRYTPTCLEFIPYTDEEKEMGLENAKGANVKRDKKDKKRLDDKMVNAAFETKKILDVSFKNYCAKKVRSLEFKVV